MSKNIEEMLIRVMEEIDYQEPGIVLNDDVREWWKKHKEDHTYNNKRENYTIMVDFIKRFVKYNGSYTNYSSEGKELLKKLGEWDE